MSDASLLLSQGVSERALISLRECKERWIEPMRRLPILAACLALLVTMGLETTKASAAVSISLRIGDRYPGPRLAFYERPDVVVIPGTSVYYIDNSDYDLYRYGDSWYYYYDGGWYRSYDYDGPFYFISYQAVPAPIRVVPVRYRHHWRSYRGPMYTYYQGARWYRSNPGTHMTSYQYRESRQSNEYPRTSGTYREDRTYRENRPYRETTTYHRNNQDRGGQSQGGQSAPGNRGRGRGRGNQDHGQGQGGSHGHGHGGD
jgi:hypothetical protein